uniref:Large ribosomal subunit protein uL22m n=1 Tax=Salarias fasciatus TaxID=181472 RepID=A0A672I9R3_SALFA
KHEGLDRSGGGEFLLDRRPAGHPVQTVLLHEHVRLSRTDRVLMSPAPGPGPQQLCRLHAGAGLQARNWEKKNLQVFPPQRPDEARRPAEVFHSRRQIKYSKDKMWYLAKLIRGMSVDQAVAQLQFSDKKGARIMKEVLLEAQDLAVRNHNVEHRSNLYVAESFSGKGQYLKRIRYHGRGMFGIMDRVYCSYFVRLVEGAAPRGAGPSRLDRAQDHVHKLKNRTIIHSL